MELKEWTHPTCPHALPRLLTVEMDQNQLQEERVWMQMRSRNIREELSDAIRLLFAQEETLAVQEEKEVGPGSIQRRDIRPVHNDNRHLIRTKNPAFLHIQLGRIPTYNPITSLW